MSGMRYKNGKLLLIVLIFILICIALFLIIPVVTGPLSKWSKLNCKYTDVDINTGRIRYTRYLFYRKTSEKIEDSVITKTIGQSGPGVSSDWKRVSAFCPGSISPHYKYHSAISHIHIVEMLLQSHDFSDEAKRYIAQSVLNRWQTQGNAFGIDKYLYDLWNIADQKAESVPNVTLSIDDLSTIAVE
jgi:hypothetical protein